jgi:phosphoglycolate phosphatase
MREIQRKSIAILLDLDGTIVDSREAYLEAMKTAFRSIGHKLIDVGTVTEIPKRLEQNLAIDDLLIGLDVKSFLGIYLRTYYENTATKSKLIPNVSEALRRLSEKANLALTTMRYVSKQQVLKELEKLGVAKYFRIVLTALDTCNSKPSPEALLKCAREFNVETGRCVVVGDSVVDIRAGKNAGAKTVGVLTGIFSRKELEAEKPDLILESVNELPESLDLLLK